MPTRGQKAGSTLGAGLGGAGLGATIGSIVPGIGTAIGAGIGGLLGGTGGFLATGETDQARSKRLARQRAQSRQLGENQSSTPESSWWSGTPGHVETYNQYTPEQQIALSQLLNQSLGNLGTNAIEESARNNFSQRTIPSIAERFTQLGAQRSSAFPQLLSQAAADLESNLASMKEERANRLLEYGLRPQFDSIYKQGTPGFGQQLTGDILRNLLTGENIGGGLGALRDAYNNRQGAQNVQNGTSLPGINMNRVPVLPTNSQQQAWTSNPANLVRGTSVPTGIVPGIGGQPRVGTNMFAPTVTAPRAPINTGFGAMQNLGLI